MSSTAAKPERMAYVYRIPGCGCVVAAQVDDPNLRRSVASFKRDASKRGFDLEHLPLTEAQALPWGWPCEHMKAAGEQRRTTEAAKPRPQEFVLEVNEARVAQPSRAARREPEGKR